MTKLEINKVIHYYTFTQHCLDVLCNFNPVLTDI